MTSTTSTKLGWAERNDFDAYQAKLAVETGEFTSFNVSRAQYNDSDVNCTVVLDAEGVEQATKQKLSEILVGETEEADSIIENVDKNLEATKINSI